MLKRKQVMIGTSHMQLWDEAGNFIASFERAEDPEMCRFLADMVQRHRYTARIEAGASTEALRQAVA